MREFASASAQMWVEGWNKHMVLLGVGNRQKGKQ
jgi:hypothetical protein